MGKKEVYVAFDPGENLGFAVVDSEMNIIASGVAPIEKGLSEGDLFLAIVGWLRDFLKKYPTENRVGVEGGIFAPKFRNTLTDEIRGLIKYSIAVSGQKWELVSPSAAKKAVTGNGRAKKKEVQNRVEEIFGMNIETSHEADALAIVYFLARQSYLEEDK